MSAKTHGIRVVFWLPSQRTRQNDYETRHPFLTSPGYVRKTPSTGRLSP